MTSLMRNVVLLQWLYNIRPTGDQISGGYKVHNRITCESKNSICCFPREFVSFIHPRELVSFDPRHVTHSPPIGKRI